MTQDEFENKFRGRMLLFVVEAWTVRDKKPSELGLILEGHNVRAMELMRQMYNVLAPKEPQRQPAPRPATAGRPT